MYSVVRVLQYASQMAKGMGYWPGPLTGKLLCPRLLVQISWHERIDSENNAQCRSEKEFALGLIESVTLTGSQGRRKFADVCVTQA